LRRLVGGALVLVGPEQPQAAPLPYGETTVSGRPFHYYHVGTGVLFCRQWAIDALWRVTWKDVTCLRCLRKRASAKQGRTR
jgi:hypothetical protein